MIYHKQQTNMSADMSADVGFPKTLKMNTPGEETPFPTFLKPAVVGCFSLGSSRNYVEGPQHLKFLRLPAELDRVNFDLDELTRLDGQGHGAGMDSEMHTQTNELVHLLKWIHEEEHRFLER